MNSVNTIFADCDFGVRLGTNMYKYVSRKKTEKRGLEMDLKKCIWKKSFLTGYQT